MNDNDILDNDILDIVKDGLEDVHMSTPVTTIIADGRSRRHRRRLATGAVAGIAALAAGLTLALPTGGGATTPPSATVNPTVRLAAFTLVNNRDGTDTLTFVKGRPLNPQTLRAALAGAGIPAIITIGSDCNTAPEPTGLDKVLATQPRSDGSVILVITPAAMPENALLSIGLKPATGPGTDDRVRFSLLAAGAPRTCTPYQ